MVKPVQELTKTKIPTWWVGVVFILTLVVNYLSTTGQLLFAYETAQVSDMYATPLTPPGFTFSIWSIIYLGMALVLYQARKANTDQGLSFALNQVVLRPFLIWMVLNALWLMSWGNDLLLVSFLFITLYAKTLIDLVKEVSRNRFLRQAKWSVKYPIGLHAGWLFVATIQNLLAYATSLGLRMPPTLLWVTAIIVALVILVGLYYYVATYGNVAMLVPSIWATFAIAFQARPGTATESIPVFWVIGVTFILLVIMLIYLVYLQQQQKG